MAEVSATTVQLKKADSLIGTAAWEVPPLSLISVSTSNVKPGFRKPMSFLSVHVLDIVYHGFHLVRPRAHPPELLYTREVRAIPLAL